MIVPQRQLRLTRQIYTVIETCSLPPNKLLGHIFKSHLPLIYRDRN